MTVLVNRRSDFSLDNFRRVTFGGESVEIGPVAGFAMDAVRQGVPRPPRLGPVGVHLRDDDPAGDRGGDGDPAGAAA
jgi:hypothetical protein